MSKKNEENTEQQAVQQTQEQAAVATAATFLDTLKDKGTAILKASSREELANMVNTIPADVKYGAGAAGYNHETREYSLRLDLVK